MEEIRKFKTCKIGNIHHIIGGNVNIFFIRELIIFTICGCYCSIAKSHTSDYIAYYQQCTKAELNICSLNIDSAFIYYKKAFSIVNNPITADLYNATICAAILQKDSIMFEWMHSCLIKGVNISHFQNNLFVFEPYINDDRWQKTLNQRDSFTNIYISGIDTNYRNALKKLNYFDQQVRNKIKPWHFLFPNSKSFRKKYAQLNKMDSSNRLVIDSLILLRGYPCEQTIGIGNWFGCEIPISIYHYRDSVFIFDVMFRALKEGKLSPRNYAQKIDDFKFVNQEESFYYILANPTYITLENKIIVNQRRNLIGLPTLEEEEMMRSYYRKTKNPYRFYMDIPFSKR